MVSAGRVTANYPLRLAWPGRCRGLFASLVPLVLLLGCSASPIHSSSVKDLPPLQLDGRSLAVEAVASRTPTPDLLTTDQEMRDFVQLYTGGVRDRRQRLTMLHRAITGAGTLDLEYDPMADGSAREVFHRESANCLSFANLFVALAREAGLDASYQWLEVRPQWTRSGERVMVRLHINVAVDLGSGGEYMVDIDPLPSRDVAATQRISDVDAQALYHNNIAMDALANENLELAWLHLVRALQLSPQTSHLWVNLGAVYRLAGQHRAAESSYLYALQLNPAERSAMNNLVVLYSIEGREADREYWDLRVGRYRDANPYYHAWLGDRAGQADDWNGALAHYEKALSLLPDDSRLLYAMGMVNYQLDELPAASAYLTRAIAAATLRSDVETYQMQLHALQAEQVAGL